MPFSEEDKEGFIHEVLEVEPDTVLDRVDWLMKVQPFYPLSVSKNDNAMLQKFNNFSIE